MGTDSSIGTSVFMWQVTSIKAIGYPTMLPFQLFLLDLTIFEFRHFNMLIAGVM